jgi:hypothetical protein
MPSICILIAILLSSSAVGYSPQLQRGEPKTTQWQRDLFTRQNNLARQLSNAAEQPVLDYFAHNGPFRDSLKTCCPELASQSAAALLALYKELFETSEMVHNFEAAPGGRHGDVDVVIGSRTSFFQNLWELEVLNYTHSMSSHTSTTQDDAEVDLFGYKPFKNTSNMPTLAEAAERPVYTALNFVRCDTGNPGFGSVAAVFDSIYLRNATLISAVDSGLYEMTCNNTAPSPPKPSPPPSPVPPHPPSTCPGPSTAGDPQAMKHGGNCAAYESHAVGTFDHFTHLILPNVLYWNNTITLAQILCRAARPWGQNNLSYSWLNTYYEANIGAEVARIQRASK